MSTDLTLASVSGDTMGAMAVLCGAAAKIHEINRANVFYRFVLGRQLIAIRDKQLWRGIFTTRAPVATWDEWLRVEFAAITGFGDGTAFGAIKIASSPALRNLEETDLRQFQNLYNAIQLARAEANGRTVTPALIEAAQTQPVARFRALLGVQNGQGRVEHIVDDAATATDLQAIVCLLKQCRPENVRLLRELVCDTLMRMAGGNPNDVIEAVLAAVNADIDSQIEPKPAVYGDAVDVESFHTNQQGDES